MPKIKKKISVHAQKENPHTKHIYQADANRTLVPFATATNKQTKDVLFGHSNALRSDFGIGALRIGPHTTSQTKHEQKIGTICGAMKDFLNEKGGNTIESDLPQ